MDDAKTKELLGHFYLDLYRRDNKFSEAAVFPLVGRVKLADEIVPSAAAMIFNLEKPTETESSLLYHSGVETFFHEFGHLLHNICSESNISRFSGTNVEVDFVELPSQMLENWIWNKEIIKKVSKHHINGQSLPEELIDQKIKIKNLNAACATLN